MQRTRIALLLGLAIATVLPASAQDQDRVKRDLAQLQGEWSMVSGSADGSPVPDSMLAEAKRVCKGDETTVMIGQQLIMKAKFTLDPSKQPKAIDYQVIDGATKGQTHLGIYELNGDSVKFCFGAPGAPRPTDFASKPGDQRTSTVWKRQKPAEPGQK
ncbi:MAG: TIGR03067 domain-containing protein [Planctomycetes bacterium]|nr:TIGR03067 domain-containing protein [Planctomycetota bacterium]